MAGGLVDMVIVTIAGVGVGQATDIGACMSTSVHDWDLNNIYQRTSI